MIVAAEQMNNDPDMLSQSIIGIGTINEIDGSLVPMIKGYTVFQIWLFEEIPNTCQRFQKEVIKIKPEDLESFGKHMGSI